MDRVTVYLGSRCNLDCKYCHREAGEEHGVSQALLDKLQGVTYVSFIGGEPTLYMREIKKVVDALPPTTRYRITTNGKDFGKYREYFLQHRFFVVISYDGDNALRGYDPFQEAVDYPWLGVSTTLYHGNTDFSRLFRDFAEKEKIVRRPLSFFPHIMHVTSPHNSPYALTIQDMREIGGQHSIRVASFVEDYEDYGIVNERYKGLFRQLYERAAFHYVWGETYCVNHRIAKMDTDGNAWSCLYIRDTTQEDMLAEMEKKFPRCANCSVYDMCGGACVKSIQHERECYLYDLLYTWYKYFAKIHHAAIEELGRME